MADDSLTIFGILFFMAYSVFFVMHYGKAALDGIFKKEMQFYGLTSWDFSKQHRLQGNAALVGGIFFTIMCLDCIGGWIGLILRNLQK